MSRLFKTLQARLLLILLCSSAVIGGLTMLLMFFVSYQTKLHESEQQINQLMDTVEYSAAIAAYSSNSEVASDVIKGLMREAAVCQALLYNGSGMSFKQGKYSNTRDCPETIQHVLYSPFDAQEVIGHLETRVDSSIIKTRAYRYAGDLAMSLMALLLLPSIVIGWAISRYITHPIQNFSRQLHTLAPGTSERLTTPAHTPSEINQLITDSNSLLGNIEKVLQEERAQRLEIEALKEKFQHLAQHDNLTGLPNRALFNERLQQMLLQAKRHSLRGALIYLDLDKFKPVNDTLGHDIGDLLLQAVAQRLLGVVRASDTVARLGGDEFVVILPALHDSPTEARVIAEKILHALQQPFELATHTLQIGSSLGIACYPEHGADEFTLAKHADLAMYCAKQNGRNCVQLFQPELTGV
ncbi:MAG: diguanylate cyclase domain-containing protein [Gallionella sp.]